MSSRFSIIGSGNSTGVPWLYCAINKDYRCQVCQNCLDDPDSRNVRNNVSSIVSYAHPDGRTRHILIDVGKTFRSTVMRQFEKLGISRLDAVILTHPHADAMNGLDDLRDVSPDTRLPVYCSEVTFKRIAASFEYLVKGAPIAGLFIAQLDWRIVRPFEPFEVEGLQVTPLPVEHGEPGPMLAFEFWRTVPAAGAPATDAPVEAPSTAASARAVPAAAASAKGQRIVYISDIAALPLDTRAYLQSGPPIDLAVIDALSYRSYPTHFSLKQAVACGLDLRAAHTVLVGMNHRIDHYAEAPKLEAFGAARGLRMELAYDGWSADVALDAPAPRGAIIGDLCAALATASADWCEGKVAVATTADHLKPALPSTATEEVEAVPPAAAAAAGGPEGAAAAAPAGYRPRRPSELAAEGGFSSLPSPPPDVTRDHMGRPGPVVATAGSRPSRRAVVADRPRRMTPLDAEFDAAAEELVASAGPSQGTEGAPGAAAGAPAAFQGWVRPSQLPSLRPLVTGTTGDGSHRRAGPAAADCCAGSSGETLSAGHAAAVTAAPTAVTSSSLAAGAAEASASNGTAVASSTAPWPLIKGRPPAVTYLDAVLPEWDEAASPSLSAHAPAIARLTTPAPPNAGVAAAAPVLMSR